MPLAAARQMLIYSYYASRACVWNRHGAVLSVIPCRSHLKKALFCEHLFTIWRVTSSMFFCLNYAVNILHVALTPTSTTSRRKRERKRSKTDKHTDQTVKRQPQRQPQRSSHIFVVTLFGSASSSPVSGCLPRCLHKLMLRMLSVKLSRTIDYSRTISNDLLRSSVSCIRSRI